MSETKFTPGPWIPAGPSFGEPKMKYANSVIPDRDDDEYPDDICEMPLLFYDEEQEANAHLIAAAPDMYEELECARDLFRFYQSHHEFKGGTEKAIRNKKIADRIDRLLAKARGEA